MKNYDHIKIEKKWQKEWDKKKVYKTEDKSKKKKFYVLDMFPYPSGAGLHVGHPRGYIGSDVYARMKRMAGYNVLHPMGYDAFGLPAEQYAIEHKIYPKKAVDINVKTFERQLSVIGLSYDWSRRINTTDSDYYKWTQWIFLQIYNSWYDRKSDKARPISELIKTFEKSGNKNINAVCDTNFTQTFSAKEWKVYSLIEKQNMLMKYRLAYEGYALVNWCPKLGTVLANDEIVEDKDGNAVSERGGYPVEKISMRQWFMRITAYADRLLADSEGLNWSTHIKEIQKNWIGRSEGSEIEFKTSINRNIKVFTTRADTLFGVTYVVLSPEHSNIGEFLVQSKNMAEVSSYIREAKERLKKGMVDEKVKTGIELKGITAINPTNGEEVPVWVADYVLAGYGTGAVMAVPAHDERDYEFAKKYNLPVRYVIAEEKIDIRPEMSTRPGLPVHKRRVIRAVVKHWSEDKYLILTWKSFGWKTFISGGIEENEDMIEAAKREILEETGYKNIKFKYEVGAPFRVKFFAPNKNQNRDDIQQGLYFILENDQREETSDHEKKIHNVDWVGAKELESILKNNLVDPTIWDRILKQQLCSLNDGLLINSGKFNDLRSEEARTQITKAVGGKIVTKYKMRDAIFARQRYWGEPIPLVTNKDGLIISLKEKNLPLKLPNVNSYEPTGTGESPLAGVKSWVKEGYETNTMPGWAGSSWYFLRYMDPKNKNEFASKKSLAYWKDVDMYIGGQEHATGHLLYSRFWHKFLFDIGKVPTKEPFKTLKNQGLIIASDGRKMSKRWGNVINPDEIVKTYGADTLRVYEMFMGPFDQTVSWSTESIIGSRRFVERSYRLSEKITKKYSQKNDLSKILHKTIKKVTEDIETLSFNTAVSSMMVFLNEADKYPEISVVDFKLFLQILAPFAPHITDELWYELGEKKSIHTSVWPKWDKKMIIDTTIKIALQVNGKVRAELMISINMSEEEIKAEALKDKAIIPWIDGKEIKKVIYVVGRLVNIVI